MPKMSQTGMKAMTQKPISKSVGMGEPLVIHVCMKGEKDDEDEGEMEDDTGQETEKPVKKKARG